MLEYERTPLNIQLVSRLLKRELVGFFDGLSECTCSSVVFSRFLLAVTSAASSSSQDCAVCHYNTEENRIWS